MISLLCPTRQRSEMLADSIKSLGDGDWELLISYDDDDPEITSYEAMRYKKVRLFPQPRHGYENLHLYFNHMAENSKGDWLMLWNDDALMLSKGWVEIIEKEDPTNPQVLNPWNERDNLFPIISRAWYEAVGHYSRNTHADSWVQQTAELINRTKYIEGIQIKHYGEELSDETHNRVKSMVGQSSEAYRRMEEERREDARKVNEYLERVKK